MATYNLSSEKIEEVENVLGLLGRAKYGFEVRAGEWKAAEEKCHNLYSKRKIVMASAAVAAAQVAAMKVDEMILEMLTAIESACDIGAK